MSGGIDSPVAIHLMKDRLEIIAVHFHQVPLSGEKEIEKVRELCRKLEIKRVYLVPFTPVFAALVKESRHKDYFILQKISMFKAAEKIAEKEGAKFLITGENLAQVSSQTLSNMVTITKNLSLEVFRPVLAYDKQEIVKIAQQIGTYDISKGPEICCLLGPKHPATKSDPEVIRKELERLALDKLMGECLEKAEVFEV